MFKLNLNEKRHDFWPQLNIAPMDKALWRQWNTHPWFIAPMKKVWFYKRFFFEAVMAMVKDNKNI